MNLKEIRKQKKMTQREVAEACGTTQGAYNHWEIGIRSPKPETLRKIAEVLGCSVDELLADPKEA